MFWHNVVQQPKLQRCAKDWDKNSTISSNTWRCLPPPPPGLMHFRLPCANVHAGSPQWKDVCVLSSIVFELEEYPLGTHTMLNTFPTLYVSCTVQHIGKAGNCGDLLKLLHCYTCHEEAPLFAQTVFINLQTWICIKNHMWLQGSIHVPPTVCL